MAFELNDIEIQFPILGMDRRLPGKDTPPGTTSNAVNVRPDDTEEGRIRGGSRPGTQKSFLTEFGGGSKIQHVGQLNRRASKFTSFFSQTFENTTLDPENWTDSNITDSGTPTNLALDNGTGPLKIVDAGRNSAELQYNKPDDFDPDQPYKVTYTCNYRDTEILSGNSDKDSFAFILRLDDTDPDFTTGPNGVALWINFFVDDTDPFVFKTRIQSVVGGVINEFENGTFTSPASLFDEPVEYSAEMDGERLTVMINGTTTFDDIVPDNVSVMPGTNIVLELFEANAPEDPPTLNIEKFSFQYNTLPGFGDGGSGGSGGGGDSSTSTTTLGGSGGIAGLGSRHLIVVANGQFYSENDIGEMNEIVGPATLNSNEQLQGIDHLSRYYIADFGDQQVEGNDGALSADGLTLTVADEDFGANYDIDIDSHIIEFFLASKPTTVLGTHAIATVGTTTLVLSKSANDGVTADPLVSYRVERGPKVFDPTLLPGARLFNFVTDDNIEFGAVPPACRLVTRFRDRLCWAGSIHEPHLWYQSRQGVPTDYQYFPQSNEVQRAVAGESSESGAMGDIIRSQIPHSDDYLIYGSPNSMWVLRGDPAYGGSLDNISRNIGMMSSDAWTYGPSGELIFLTRDGIYSNERGIAAPVQSVSREHLPRELREVNPNVFQVTMAYDEEERGIHIMVSAFDSSIASNHFFLLWPAKAFFSVDFTDRHDPFTLWNYSASDTSRNAVLMGCRDGFIREFTFDKSSDDGAGVKSIVSLGPFYISSNSTREGILQNLSVDIDDDSSDLIVSVITGKNHAEVIDKANAYIASRL